MRHPRSREWTLGPLISLTLACATATPTRAPPSKAPATLSGVVYDMHSFRALRDISVHLESPCIQGSRETRTTPDGAFKIGGLPPCRYILTVTVKDFTVRKNFILTSSGAHINAGVDPDASLDATDVLPSRPGSPPRIRVKISP